jgi:hypothetical protein
MSANGGGLVAGSRRSAGAVHEMMKLLPAATTVGAIAACTTQSSPYRSASESYLRVEWEGSPVMSNPPAGWYPDPDNGALPRFAKPATWELWRYVRGGHER